MSVVTVIINYLILHWPAILSLVGGAAGLSIALEVVLKKFHVSSKKVAFSLLHLTTLLSTIATIYLANKPNSDALPIYASLALFAEAWNRFAVSPAFSKIVVPYLNYLSATKPQTGVPVVPVGSSPDFPA
jgi:hypothetical protein